MLNCGSKLCELITALNRALNVINLDGGAVARSGNKNLTKNSIVIFHPNKFSNSVGLTTVSSKQSVRGEIKESVNKILLYKYLKCLMCCKFNLLSD